MKNYTTSPKSGNSSMPQHEFDFSSVNKNDLELCCLYEYARESRALLSSIDIMRTFSNEKAKKQNSLPPWFGRDRGEDGWPHASASMAELFPHFLCVADFPSKPWQLLSANDRQILSQNKSESGILQLELDPPLEFLTVADWETFSGPKMIEAFSERYESKARAIRTGVFYLNLEYETEHIIKGFESWLVKVKAKRNRGNAVSDAPDSRKQKTEKRGRQNCYRDSLRELGALRVRHSGCSLSAAQELTKEAGDSKFHTRYSDRTSWNRACKRAIYHFGQFFPSQLPIHFSEGWQK